MNQIIFSFLNNFALQNHWLDTLVIFCATYLPFWLVAILVSYYLYKFFRKGEFSFYKLKAVSVIILSAFAVWGISQIINFLYYSPRPFWFNDNINLLFTHGNVDSFPSGHTTFFFTLALMGYYYHPKWLFNSLLIGAFLIGLARVVTGVHWPLDIVGGILLSIIGVWTIKKMFKPKK